MAIPIKRVEDLRRGYDEDGHKTINIHPKCYKDVPEKYIYIIDEDGNKVLVRG